MARTARRRHRRIARDLVATLPPSADLHDVVDAVARARSRPIVLSERVMPAGGPSGVWVATASTDYVVVDAGAPSRRSVITCHELAHMLLGHVPELMASVRALAPDIDPEISSRFLARARHGYHDAQELDAEELGTLIHLELARRGESRGRDMLEVRLR